MNCHMNCHNKKIMPQNLLAPVYCCALKPSSDPLYDWNGVPLHGVLHGVYGVLHRLTILQIPRLW